MAATDQRERLTALTGVRAAAAAWVVAYHFQDLLLAAFPYLRFARPLLESGYLGVDLFFILSGFILSYNYLASFRNGTTVPGYGRFLRMRLARIYPVHLLTLHVQVLMVLAAAIVGIRLSGGEGGDEGRSFLDYLTNISLIQAWFPRHLSWNGPAWSVSAEFLAYLAFPFLAIPIARLKWKSALVSAIASYSVLAFAFSTWLSDRDTTLNGALLRIACEFVAGCCVYVVYSQRPHDRWIGWLALPSLVFGALIPWIARLRPHEYHRGIPYSAVFLLTVLSLAYGSDPVSRLLSRRWIVNAGEASYALYMTHVLVQQIVGHILPPAFFETRGPIQRGAAGMAVIAVLAIVANLTYKHFEVPMRRVLRPGRKVSGRDRAGQVG